MSAHRPLWRQGFDVVERAAGPRLASLARSEAFAVSLGLALQAKRRVQARAERSTRRLLHLANLPAGSDVTRILAELGRLQAQVRELSRQVGEAQEGARDDGSPGDDRPPRSSEARR